MAGLPGIVRHIHRILRDIHRTFSYVGAVSLPHLLCFYCCGESVSMQRHRSYQVVVFTYLFAFHTLVYYSIVIIFYFAAIISDVIVFGFIVSYPLFYTFTFTFFVPSAYLFEPRSYRLDGFTIATIPGLWF